MGEVYLADHLQLGRLAALKINSARTQEDSNQVLRFVREVRLHASLSHPNLVEVLDGAVERGQSYLALEYIAGGTLKQVLEAEKVLGPRHVVALSRGLASGLAYMHEKGVIHRDLKPSNILIAKGTGEVKIADFGLARSEEGTVLTNANRVLGTPAYMSPEMASGQSATPASDVFAFGVIMYECLTGRHPFPHDGLAQLLHSIREVEPADLAQAETQAPEPLVSLVKDCMEKDPAARPGFKIIKARLKRISDLQADEGSSVKTKAEIMGSGDVGIAESGQSVAGTGTKGSTLIRLDSTFLRVITSMGGGSSFWSLDTDHPGSRRKGALFLALPVALALGLVLFWIFTVGGRPSDPSDPVFSPGSGAAFASSPGAGASMGLEPAEGAEFLQLRAEFLRRFESRLKSRPHPLIVLDPPGEEARDGQKGLEMYSEKVAGERPSSGVRTILICLDRANVKTIHLICKLAHSSPAHLAINGNRIGSFILTAQESRDIELPVGDIRSGMNIIDLQLDKPGPDPSLRIRLERTSEPLVRPPRISLPADYAGTAREVIRLIRSGGLWEGERKAEEYLTTHSENPAARMLRVRVINTFIRGQVESQLVTIGAIASASSDGSGSSARHVFENLAIAFENLAETLRFDPGNARAWTHLGACLVMAGIEDAGYPCMEFAVLMEPDDGLSWNQFYDMHDIQIVTGRRKWWRPEDIVKTETIGLGLNSAIKEEYLVKCTHIALSRLEQEINRSK